jgi:hypothetical protein
VPLASTAELEFQPAEICTGAAGKVSGTAVRVMFVVPLPAWPSGFQPQP